MATLRTVFASLLLTSAVALPLSAEELSGEMIAKVNELIDQDTARLTEMFKDIHRHPEIGFTEFRTAGIVSDELTKLGFKVTTGIATTGVVGVLENGPGPVVWFRADMDANGGVTEVTGLDYAAAGPQTLPDGTTLAAMHACGHDAHVTWMLGMAKAMVDLKSEWSGTLVVYGQPAEEPGLGAKAMVDDGLWERGFPKPDVALGAHTAPGPVGYVSNSPGVRMAGTDQLDIEFFGRGAHGSQPHLSIDPIVMAAQAVMMFQTIVSRTMDPQASTVVTVGSIQAGRDNNVIPSSAKLLANLRWLTMEDREKMIRRIDEISRGIAVANGVPEDQMPVRTMKGFAGPLVNDAEVVAKIDPGLRALLGADKVVGNFPTVMGSEDFQEVFSGTGVPYAYLLVGVAPEEMFMAALAEGKPQPYSNHNPNFFVDLAAIPIGAKVDTVAVLSYLQKDM